MSALNTIKQSSFLKQNAIFFVGAFSVSVLNYLYYPALGRLLSLSEYGEVQILISFFLQLTIFMSVLGQVTVNVVSNHTDIVQRNKIITELQKVAFFISIAIFLAGSMASWWIASLLQFGSPLPFIVLLVALIATVPLTFQASYLRGIEKFGAASLTSVIGSISKIVCSVLFVLMGWGAAGAIGGVVAAQLIAFLYALRLCRQLDYSPSFDRKFFTLPDLKTIRPELKYSLFVLVASLGVTIMSSVDTVIVKAFFNPEVAGGYAGVSTVAKIIFFMTASISQVMLPSIKLKASKKENRRLFLKSFILLASLGGGVLVVFALFPRFVLTTLMGESFAPYAHILPALSFALFLVSIINLLVYYYIALRNYRIIWVVCAGVFLTTMLLFFNHSTLNTIVVNLVYGSLAFLLIFAAWRGGYEFVARRKVE